MNDEQFERWLGEFKPQKVRALELPVCQPRFGIHWLAAAAIVLCLAGGWAWEIHHRRSEKGKGPTQPSSFAMTRMAMGDAKEFDALLDEQSRNVLPNFRDDHSTLRVLAKE